MQRCALAVLLVATLQSLPTAYAAGTGKYLNIDGCPPGSDCIFQPTNCISQKKCNIGLAISKDRTSNSDGGFYFEMWASYKGYVAVALADQFGMGNDSVIECVAVGDKVTAYMSRNFPPSFRPVHERLPEADQADISQISSSNTDGVISCKVKRKAITTVIGKTYNLDEGNWVIQLVAGDTASATAISGHNVYARTTGKWKINTGIGPLLAITSNDPALPSSGSVLQPALATLTALTLAALRYI